MSQVAAVDLGAESGRVMAVAWSDSGITATEINRFETPVIYDETGRRCWNFPEIMRNIKRGLSDMGSSGHVRAIGVDTWGLDGGFLNEADELIGDPISYRDPRTQGMVEECSAVVGRERLYGDTGCQLLECNTIFQFRAMRLQTPAELDEASRFLFMPDLVQHELCGSIDSEYTIASTSGLLDIRTGDWARSLAADLGVPDRILPPVVAPGTNRGRLRPQVAREIGLPDTECIATTSHDTAAAVVATPFTQPGDAFISSGTWSLVGVETRTPVIDDATREGSITNEGGYDDTVRLLRNVMGLWLLQECRRAWKDEGQEHSYQQLVEMAQEAPSWQSFIHTDDPKFLHAGGMPQRIRNFAANTGQKEPESLSEITRCVLESLALQYAETFDLLEACTGTPMKTVHITGGGSQNSMLCQMTADISGRVVVAGPVEATAMGNAIVQWISLGEIADVAAGRELVLRSGEFATYEPRDMPRQSEIRERYREIVATSKTLG